MNTNINEDLQRERRKCTFDPLELTHLLDGSPKQTALRREIEQFFLNDPELRDEVPTRYKSHKEVYEESVRKGCIILKKIRDLQNMGKADVRIFGQVLGGMLGSAISKEGNPLAIHWIMFIPSLMSQATPGQQKLWLLRALDFNILGTYAQTELGHGTFLRGLETTATYNPVRKEFILNTPTLTSYKWWPGGMGQTANYGIVVAQLYINGDCKGTHHFIVQLRNEETHEPLKGIKIGEIGSKLGMNAYNNGFLCLNNVRIPRENMLMKNAKVLEDGTYITAPSHKLNYSTMMRVRVLLVKEMSRYLAKGVTIAVRYSIVRKQGYIRSDDRGETPILDYVTQQYKIFPHLASCYAFNWAANWIWEMYDNVTDELAQGELDRLPELHALSCCLKAVATSDATIAIEQLRLSCGGHGYMDSSSFPATYGLVSATCTYEGDNTVLLLTTARYLLKAWRKACRAETLPPTVEYLLCLVRKIRKITSWDNTLTCMVLAHQDVAAGKIKEAAEHMERRIREGITEEEAWNETSIEWAHAAESHCRAFIIQRYVEAVESATSISHSLQRVLTSICELYAIHWILQRLGDFLRFSCLQKENVESLQKRLERLLSIIRENVVCTVDGFDLRDEVIGSVLGAYDGNVYQRLYDEAMMSPLNQESVNSSFHKYLKPFLKSNL